MGQAFLERTPSRPPYKPSLVIKHYSYYNTKAILFYILESLIKTIYLFYWNNHFMYQTGPNVTLKFERPSLTCSRKTSAHTHAVSCIWVAISPTLNFSLLIFSLWLDIWDLEDEFLRENPLIFITKILILLDSRHSYGSSFSRANTVETTLQTFFGY